MNESHSINANFGPTASGFPPPVVHAIKRLEDGLRMRVPGAWCTSQVQKGDAGRALSSNGGFPSRYFAVHRGHA